MMTSTPDVLVVGAGPAGAAVALDARRRARRRARRSRSFPRAVCGCCLADRGDRHATSASGPRRRGDPAPFRGDLHHGPRVELPFRGSVVLSANVSTTRLVETQGPGRDRARTHPGHRPTRWHGRDRAPTRVSRPRRHLESWWSPAASTARPSMVIPRSNGPSEARGDSTPFLGHPLGGSPRTPPEGTLTMIAGRRLLGLVRLPDDSICGPRPGRDEASRRTGAARRPPAGGGRTRRPRGSRAIRSLASTARLAWSPGRRWPDRLRRHWLGLRRTLHRGGHVVGTGRRGTARRSSIEHSRKEPPSTPEGRALASTQRERIRAARVALAARHPVVIHGIVRTLARIPSIRVDSRVPRAAPLSPPRRTSSGNRLVITDRTPVSDGTDHTATPPGILDVEQVDGDRRPSHISAEVPRRCCVDCTSDRASTDAMRRWSSPTARPDLRDRSPG